MMQQLWLKRGLLLTLAAVAVALSISFRMGHVGPDDFIDAERAEGIQPDQWQMLDSTDWVRLTEQAQAAGNRDQALSYALHALAINPTSGDAAAQLIGILSSQNKPAEAAQFAELAGRLWTAKSYPHIHLAAYWSQQGQWDKMLAEWNILLIRDPSLRTPILPHFQKLAIDPATTHLFDPFAKNPPLWWAGFFNYLVADKQTPAELLARLYALRITSTAPLADWESAPYVARLGEEQHWTESHEVWLAGLPTELRSLRGLVYDGGFEGERHNTGFDWFYRNDAQVNIQSDNTLGSSGQHALKISFKSSRHVNFQHLWQHLVLPPATYQLDWRLRADGLRSDKGLRWRIYCLADNRLLAESPVLKKEGNSLWTKLNVEFSVPPDNCPVQQLRLEANSPYAHDQVFAGTLWLDDIAIVRKTIHE
jgi:tetratricopeptide (TPR) repeat protein